jgi:hypothetical protein
MMYCKHFGSVNMGVSKDFECPKASHFSTNHAGAIVPQPEKYIP